MPKADEILDKRERLGFEFIETPDDIDFRMSPTARAVMVVIGLVTVTALVAVFAFLITTGNWDFIARRG
ncbi:MAG TPA: hypothetical protein VNJ09_06580 [Chthonomonadales bacterium]|nr:hypothetical protein [Chthonomonadales bacterium]